MKKRTATTLALLAAALISRAVPASAVFVQAGSTQGQGYAFQLGKLCLVLTANHVVTNAKRVELVSVAGERGLGNVIGRDSNLDLALLQILKDGNRPLPKLCRGETGIPQNVPQWVSGKSRNSQIALQRVSSHAGAVDHVLVLPGNLEGDSPWFSISNPDANAVTQGDSGATVWINNGAPRPGKESNGTLIGMAVAVEGGAVRVLRSDFMQQSVYSMLWPIDKEKIRFAAGEGARVSMAYGTAPDLGSTQLRSMNWSAGAATAHFILDLGDRDTTVEGVSVSRGVLTRLVGDLLKGLVAQSGTNADTLSVVVQTSSRRPNDGGTWVNQRCMKRDVRAVMNVCQFQSSMVVRGMIIRLEGDIPHLSAVRLHISR